MTLAVGFLESTAIFQSTAQLVAGFRATAAACEDPRDLRVELQVLYHALHIVGSDEAGRKLGLQAHFFRNEESEVDGIAETLGTIDEHALEWLRRGFIGRDGEFGLNQNAPERATRAFGSSEGHGRPIASLLAIPMDRHRTGAMGADGFPEKINLYFVPVGPDGTLGAEPLSFLIRDDALYLGQVNGGRCLWIGALNCFQSAQEEPLTTVELLEGFRVLMEQVGRPLQRSYNPMEFVRLYNEFGGEATLVRGEGRADEAAQALAEGKRILVFESGGTRSILGRTEEGRIKWFNFFQGRLEEIEWEEFSRRLTHHYSIIVDPEILGRMIGYDES